MSKEMVNHPSHYNSGKIEIIEAIEDWKLSYHRGCVVKYTARAGKKDPTKEIEDLQKAEWYLKRDIENLHAIKEGRAPVRPNDMNPREEDKAQMKLGLKDGGLTVEMAGEWVQIEIDGEEAMYFQPWDQEFFKRRVQPGDQTTLTVTV